MYPEQNNLQMAGQALGKQHFANAAMCDAPPPSAPSLTDTLRSTRELLISQNQLIAMMEEAILGARPEKPQSQEVPILSIIDAAQMLLSAVVEHNQRIDYLVSRLGGR